MICAGPPLPVGYNFAESKRWFIFGIFRVLNLADYTWLLVLGQPIFCAENKPPFIFGINFYAQCHAGCGEQGFFICMFFVCVWILDFGPRARYNFGMRLDVALVSQNIYPTRTRALAAIRAGLVTVNGAVATKPSLAVSDSDVLAGGALPYSVGRGSLKLERALDEFKINPDGMGCLDIGASTGGFTATLLARGAARVIAVDVGTNQLVPELRNDPRVVSLEQTDIRKLAPIEPVDLVVIDVSFISLADIAPVLQAWGARTVIALIKPQFEVPRHIAARSAGVIKSHQWHEYAINRATDAFRDAGFVRAGLIESPIHGGSGNVEFLAHFVAA